MCRAKLKGSESFMFEAATHMFPTEVLRSGVKEYWRDTMLKANGSEAEIFVYDHVQFPDYVAFTHPNLNVDNAYFWRDASGRLDADIFDRGSTIKAMGMCEHG